MTDPRITASQAMSMSDYDTFSDRIKTAKDIRALVQLLDLLDALVDNGRISGQEALSLAVAIDARANEEDLL